MTLDDFLIMCGHFLFVASPTPLPHSPHFIPTSPHSLVVLYFHYKLTTEKSLSTSLSVTFWPLTAPSFASLVPTCPNKMASLSMPFALLTIVSVRYFFSLTRPLGFRRMLLPPPASTSTFARVVLARTTLLTSSSSVRPILRWPPHLRVSLLS